MASTSIAGWLSSISDEAANRREQWTDAEVSGRRWPTDAAASRYGGQV
jgi:hypothetical protein